MKSRTGAPKSVREVMSAPVVRVAGDTPVREALSLMRERRISSLFVGESPPGIVTERDIVRAMSEDRDFSALVCSELMHAPLISVGGDENHLEAYHRMSVSGIRHLAVADNDGNIVGVMTEGDILRDLEADYFHQFKNVASVMRERPCLFPPEAPLQRALEKMNEENQSAVIVVDEARMPLGILTERDVVRLAEEDAHLRTATLAEVMTHPVHTVKSSESLVVTAELMEKAKIRRMVVVDEEGRVVGLVTQHEIVQGLESRYVGFLKGMIEHHGSRKNFLDNILRSATDTAVIATDLDFCVEYCSQAAETLFGVLPAAALGMNLSELSDAGFLAVRETVAAGGEHRFEFERRGLVVDCRLSRLLDEKDVLRGFLLLARDITESRQRAAQIERLNAFYAALSQTNEAIVRSESREALLASVCRVAVEFGGLKGACVCFLSEKGDTVAPAAAYGIDAGALAETHIDADSPAALELAAGRHVIRNDYMNDPSTLRNREEAAALGVYAQGIFPLTSNAATVGALNIYADTPGFFSPDLVRLLDEMAFDLSFALGNFLREEKRKDAEAKLNASEARFRLAIAASRQGIYDLDVESGRAVANAEYAMLLGAGNEDFEEDFSQFVERIHPEDRERVMESYHEHLRGEGGEYRTEFRTRTRPGGWVWVLSTGAVVERGEGGKPRRFIGTITDIGEHKQLEEQTRLTATVFEHSREMIVVTDAERRIFAVNRAFSEITGYGAEEALGKTPSFLKSGRHERPFYQELWRAIAREGYWQGEIWDRRKNGEIFPTLQAISAVKDEAGRITHYIGMAADITEQKRAEERIRLLAFYDPLTGLPNRELFRNQAKRGLAEARRERQETAMLLLDLDHFKTINDSLGHRVGDSLLKAVAGRFSESLRETDLVGRTGGDEFLLLFPGQDASGAARIAQKLIAAFSGAFEIEGHVLNVTPSIGISIFPRDADNFDELFKNADAAMYKAKEAGRNGYYFFTSEMNAMAFERLMLESSLRRALKQQEFVLYYQPQVEIKSGRLVGLEALIRWRHPELGMVAPGKFIPIAEESNLIVQIGEWVLREACRQNKVWQEQGLPPISVAVNISARQFSQGELPGFISQVLEESGLQSEFLEVEITESMLVQDLEKTLAVLRELKQKGVRVSVDDFGTGYSSLAYLKRFPIDKLKIDQSFVRDLENDADDRAISTAVVNLGHSLGFTVIAEGVESQEQRDILARMGCDEAQGFVISEPLPADKILPFLAKP